MRIFLKLISRKTLKEVRTVLKMKYFFLSFCFLPPRKICVTILSRVHLCNDFSRNTQKRGVQLEIQETDLTLEKLGENRFVFMLKVDNLLKFSVSQRGNFFHSDFTWNQFWGFEKCKICHFNTFRASESWFWWIFALFGGWNSSI